MQIALPRLLCDCVVCGASFSLCASADVGGWRSEDASRMSIADPAGVASCVYAGGACALWSRMLLKVVKQDFPRCCTTMYQPKHTHALTWMLSAATGTVKVDH